MDFSEVVNQLIGVVVLLLTTMITVIVPLLALYLKKKWGLEVDEKQREQLVSAINNGIKYGAQVAKQQHVPQTKAVDIQVSATKDYLNANAPAALEHFHLTTESDSLEKKIVSQLPTEAAPPTIAKDKVP